MKILLTGGAGFIGSHTCVELCNAGHDPVIVDNYINSSPESIRRIEKIVGHPVPHYEADVSDKAAMDRIFSENAFDCVIHFAGLKAVGESVAQPLRSLPPPPSTETSRPFPIGRICHPLAAPTHTAGQNT